MNETDLPLTECLKDTVERFVPYAIILSEDSTLRVPMRPAAGPLATTERTQILAALPGLKPTTLESRIKKLGLQRPR